MLEVIDAQHEGGYRIRVVFNDGESGVVDLADDLWGPVFEPLRDVEQFKRFSVSKTFHTIVWENGADMAPEHLRDMLRGDPTVSGAAGVRETGRS